jgi:hypothetical protein
MRKGWKQAVQDAYEQNKAHARLAAVTVGNYTVSVQNESNMSVTFKKGILGRGDFDEVVDFLPKDVFC